MSATTITDAQQLLRLRTLRVQRARERCAAAQEQLERAQQSVHERLHRIEQGRRAMQTLARQVAHACAPRMPRWADVAAAERERLADRLERDEYALISDEHRLEQAQEDLQRERAQLTRALAREEAVRGLAQHMRQAAAHAREQRTEREQEEQARPAAGTAR